MCIRDSPTAPAKSPAGTASAPLKSGDKGTSGEISRPKAPASEAEKPVVAPRPALVTAHTPAETAGTMPDPAPAPEEKAPERIFAPAEEVRPQKAVAEPVPPVEETAPPMPEVPAIPVEDTPETEVPPEETPDAPAWRLAGEVLHLSLIHI